MAKVERCPFCGGAPEASGGRNRGFYDYQFGCGRCDIYFYADRLRDAVRKWNKRYPTSKIKDKKPTRRKVVLPELDPIQDRSI
jgi:hypothetical protein